MLCLAMLIGVSPTVHAESVQLLNGFVHLGNDSRSPFQNYGGLNPVGLSHSIAFDLDYIPEDPAIFAQLVEVDLDNHMPLYINGIPQSRLPYAPSPSPTEHTMTVNPDDLFIGTNTLRLVSLPEVGKDNYDDYAFGNAELRFTRPAQVMQQVLLDEWIHVGDDDDFPQFAPYGGVTPDYTSQWSANFTLPENADQVRLSFRQFDVALTSTQFYLNDILLRSLPTVDGVTGGSVALDSQTFIDGMNTLRLEVGYTTQYNSYDDMSLNDVIVTYTLNNDTQVIPLPTAMPVALIFGAFGLFRRQLQ